MKWVMRLVVLGFVLGMAWPAASVKKGLEWVYSRPAGIEFTKSEVTVAQYRACVKAGKCTKSTPKNEDFICNWSYKERADHPINCVDWKQAEAFCGWVGGRLPTEEEWFAEASDKGSRVYPWGKEEVSCERAIWGGKENKFDGCGRNTTWPVCSRPTGNSVSGLCDMSGNVWEWTSSWYSKRYKYRMMRGGSWYYGGPPYLRASSRMWQDPSTKSYILGFRCGRAVKPTPKGN
ncbi:MAG: SUMF1/EgtB/PvdO family nonheme iron enzyme [Deltaproteobacteria bacterium]|nr:SUMF1/EgtB/PvdO family nonheme iron enzyme [Deltaproteobacteria bacterium]